MVWICLSRKPDKCQGNTLRCTLLARVDLECFRGRYSQSISQSLSPKKSIFFNFLVSGLIGFEVLWPTVPFVPSKSYHAPLDVNLSQGRSQVSSRQMSRRCRQCFSLEHCYELMSAYCIIFSCIYSYMQLFFAMSWLPNPSCRAIRGYGQIHSNTGSLRGADPNISSVLISLK